MSDIPASTATKSTEATNIRAALSIILKDEASLIKKRYKKYALNILYIKVMLILSTILSKLKTLVKLTFLAKE